MAARKKRRLGMGLSGMIGTPVEVRSAPTAPADSPPSKAAEPTTQLTTPDQSEADPDTTTLSHISVTAIEPNAHQPRHVIDDAALEPLVSSIATAGVMQPVIVRPRGNGYELVAGERRWRAAIKAGLDTVPAIVREVDDRTAAEWAIIENVQREDLDPIDKAHAYKRLQDDFGMTHAEIAEQVGLTRAGVTNQVRLCDLDDGVRTLIRHGALSGGHGRCLLGIVSVDDRLELAKQAVHDEWSVRELERRIRQITAGPAKRSTGTVDRDASRAHLDDLEKQLGSHLGTRVQIRTSRTKGHGRVVIEFYDHDQFDGLLKHMGFTPG